MGITSINQSTQNIQNQLGFDFGADPCPNFINLDSDGLNLSRRLPALPPKQRWLHGATLPYLGKQIMLHVGSGTSFARLQHGMFNEETLLLALNADASEAHIREAACTWLKAEASRVFAQKIPQYAVQLGVTSVLQDWRLSNAKGRWGSANSRGRVRLHWRLIHCTPAMIDYVIVHELAHLREMNHSARFWAIVASIYPDYKATRKALKAISLRGLMA
jgi:predicted metal-dependent hydrolase